MKRIKISNGETRIAYSFNELDPKIQEKIIGEYADTSLEPDWWDGTYDDAKNVGIKITSFDPDRGNITGDFESEAEEIITKIIEEHGKDCETHKTALKHKQYFDEAMAKSDEEWEKEYPAEIREEEEERGGYVPTKDEYFDDNYREDLESDFKQEILEDYLILLRKEAEYLSSHELAKENIEANDCLYDEAGEQLPVTYHTKDSVVVSHSFRIGKNEYHCELEDIGSEESSAICDKLLTDTYGEHVGLNADWSIMAWTIRIEKERGFFICDDDTHKDNYIVTVRSYREEDYNTANEFEHLFEGTAQRCIDYVNRNNLK